MLTPSKDRKRVSTLYVSRSLGNSHPLLPSTSPQPRATGRGVGLTTAILALLPGVGLPISSNGRRQPRTRGPGARRAWDWGLMGSRFVIVLYTVIEL